MKASANRLIPRAPARKNSGVNGGLSVEALFFLVFLLPFLTGKKEGLSGKDKSQKLAAGNKKAELLKNVTKHNKISFETPYHWFRCSSAFGNYRMFR